MGTPPRWVAARTNMMEPPAQRSEAAREACAPHREQLTLIVQPQFREAPELPAGRWAPGEGPSFCPSAGRRSAWGP